MLKCIGIVRSCEAEIDAEGEGIITFNAYCRTPFKQGGCSALRFAVTTHKSFLGSERRGGAVPDRALADFIDGIKRDLGPAQANVRADDIRVAIEPLRLAIVLTVKQLERLNRAECFD